MTETLGLADLQRDAWVAGPRLSTMAIVASPFSSNCALSLRRPSCGVGNELHAKAKSPKMWSGPLGVVVVLVIILVGVAVLAYLVMRTSGAMPLPRRPDEQDTREVQRDLLPPPG